MQDATGVDISPEAIAHDGYLAQSAREVFLRAPQCCPPELGCVHYHRLWPIARLAKPTGPALAGADFFAQQLNRMDFSEQRRVLVFGAADTGLLATLCQGLRSKLARIRFIVVDRCPTVIWQNQLFANSLGLDVEFQIAELQSLDLDQVDAIVAHSILNFFDEAERLEVLRQWYRLLKRDGMALLSNTVYGSGRPQIRKVHPRFDASGILRFAQEKGYSVEELGLMQESLERIAQDGMQVYTPAPENDFLQLIEVSGLQVKASFRHPVTAEQMGPLSSITNLPKVRLECCLGRAQEGA